MRGLGERWVILEGKERVRVDGGAPEGVKPLDVAVIPQGARNGSPVLPNGILCKLGWMIMVGPLQRNDEP